MKKPFFLLLMIVPVLCIAQPSKETNVLLKDEYLRKSKNQRTLGIVTLSAGSLLMLIGGSMSLSELGDGLDFTGPDNYDEQKVKTGDALFYTGTGMALVSIPMFLASTKNKKRAASLAIKSNVQPLLHQKGTLARRVPVLSFTLSL